MRIKLTPVPWRTPLATQVAAHAVIEARQAHAHGRRAASGL